MLILLIFLCCCACDESSVKGRLIAESFAACTRRQTTKVISRAMIPIRSGYVGTEAPTSAVTRQEGPRGPAGAKANDSAHEEILPWRRPFASPRALHYRAGALRLDSCLALIVP